MLPPLVGVAVKVRDCPEQVGLWNRRSVMDAESVTVLFTVTVMELEVAVVDLAQAALEVTTQVTTAVS